MAVPALPGFTGPLPAGFSATKEAYADWAVEEAEARFKPLTPGINRVVPRADYEYVNKAGRAWGFHLESAYDAFRAHCKRIDYEGEMVDLKQLRRLVAESKKQGGFVTAESERVTFDSGRRRAFLVDLSKTKVVTADDFPTPEEGGSSGFRENFKGRYGRDDS